MTRLTVQPLTRVEGHGRVELTLHQGELATVRVELIEAPRLFEAIVLGRNALEVPDLICRICAICSAVHKLVALQAVEQALAVEIPPAARLVRDLLLLGGHLQSHALHLFCLILPDFSRVPNLLVLLAAGDDLARKGLALKAYGNRLQELAGGRVIHPVTPVVGGVTRRPGPAELAELDRLTGEWERQWPAVAREFAARAAYPPAGPALGQPLAVGCGGSLGLQGESLTYAAGSSLPVSAYAELLDERPVVHSHAKQSCGDRGPFRVGALARLQLAGLLAGPMALSLPGDGIHDNCAAQLWEVGWVIAEIRRRLDQLQSLEASAPCRTGPVAMRPGTGTAAMEAPRGLLIHHYVLDDWGQVAAADIVTPTAINQLVIEQQLRQDLAGCREPEQLRERTERIVRAYDPCISCAVHVLRG